MFFTAGNILLVGGMDTRFNDIRPILAQGIMLSTFEM